MGTQMNDPKIPFDVPPAQAGFPVQIWNESTRQWIDVFYIGQSADGFVTFSHLEDTRDIRIAASGMFRMKPGGMQNLEFVQRIVVDPKSGQPVESTKRVVIESPFTGRGTPYEGQFDTLLAYGKRCLWDSIEREEAPFASHLLYTQVGVPNDGNERERERGIENGLVWAAVSDLTAVYADYGISSGMQAAMDRCDREGRIWVIRKIGKNR